MTKHFTATAFIVDSQKRTLLLWHHKLQRWMPPGGHVEENESPEDTARRECKEETNLDVEIVGEDCEDLFVGNPHEGQMLKKPFALMLESIPENPKTGEPAHQHMDFLYIAQPLDEAQEMILDEKEGRETRWFSREDIAALDEKTEIFSNVKAYILRIL